MCACRHVSCSRRLFRQAIDAASDLLGGSLEADRVKALQVWCQQEQLGGHLIRVSGSTFESLPSQGDMSMSPGGNVLHSVVSQTFTIWVLNDAGPGIGERSSDV